AGPSEMKDAVLSTDLGGHERGNRAPGQSLDVLDKAAAFVAVPELFDEDRRCTHKTPGHDEAVVRQIIECDDADRSVREQHLAGEADRRVSVPSAATSQD